jgi:hypothetical protein
VPSPYDFKGRDHRNGDATMFAEIRFHPAHDVDVYDSPEGWEARAQQLSLILPHCGLKTDLKNLEERGTARLT